MHISNVSHPLQTGPVEPWGPEDRGTERLGDRGAESTGGPGNDQETRGRLRDRRAGGPRDPPYFLDFGSIRSKTFPPKGLFLVPSPSTQILGPSDSTVKCQIPRYIELE